MPDVKKTILWSFATAAIKLIYTKDAKQNKMKQNTNKQRSHRIQKKHFHFYMAAAVFAHCFWSPSSFVELGYVVCAFFLSLRLSCTNVMAFLFFSSVINSLDIDLKCFLCLLLFFLFNIRLRDVVWSTVSNEKNTRTNEISRFFVSVSKCKWSIIIFCYCSVYLFVAMIKLSREFHYWVISFGRLFMQTPTLSEASQMLCCYLLHACTPSDVPLSIMSYTPRQRKKRMIFYSNVKIDFCILHDCALFRKFGCFSFPLS